MKDVEIPSDKDDSVEELRLERNAATRLGELDLVKQDKDRGQVSKVTSQTEDVHRGFS